MTQMFDTHIEKNKETEERAGKYLTFALENEAYGIQIVKVKEIIGMMPVTAVPQTDTYVKGVINLRDRVIPVIDLRLKFGMQEVEYTERTCIIVVEIGNNGAVIPIGLVVDAVSEVNNIKAGEIDDTPAFGASMETNYILGLAKKEDGVKILLDIDRVLQTDELVRVRQAA